MLNVQNRTGHGGRGTLASLAIVCATVLGPGLGPGAPTALAQAQPERAEQRETVTLAKQIAELRASLARLERQLDRQSAGRGNAQQGSMGSGGKGSPMGGAQGGKGNKGPGNMGNMGKGGKGGMGSGNKAGGMGAKGGGMGGGKGGGKSGGKGMGMGGGKGGSGKSSGTGTAAMGSMQGSTTEQASLPGFPGSSHLYHIGATDFFLDHDEHITLDLEQRATLGGIREASQLEAATFERRLAQLEQELWVLTAADEPNIVKIEEKIRLIARVGGDQRLAFIQAVGKAAQTLTDTQRKALIGMAPAAPETPEAPAADDAHDDAHEHNGG